MLDQSREIDSAEYGPGGMKKSGLNYLMLLIIIILTCAVALKFQGQAGISAALFQADLFYLCVGLLSLLGFLFLDTAIIYHIAGHWEIKTTWLESWRFSLVGQYYSLITPLSSGAQPAQVYSMTVKGPYSIAQASSLLLVKFVIYQTGVALYALLSLAYLGIRQLTLAAPCKTFIFLGLLLNLSLLGLVFLLVFKNKSLKRMLVFLLSIVHKTGLGKSLSEESLISEVDIFSAYLQKMKGDKQLLFHLSSATFWQLTAYFSTTYFAARALGINNLDYAMIVALQALLYMAYHFFPTPGNAGIAEGGFYLFYQTVFPGQLILPAVLLWRFLVYYTNLLISGLTVFYEYLLVGYQKAQSDIELSQVPRDILVDSGANRPSKKRQLL